MIQIKIQIGEDSFDFSQNEDAIIDFLRETLLPEGFTREEVYALVNEINSFAPGEQYDVSGSYGTILTVSALEGCGQG